MEVRGFSVVIIPENKSFSAWCPELDVASQGSTIGKAVSNLKEAIELHLGCLSSSELKELKSRQASSFVTTVEVPLPV